MKKSHSLHLFLFCIAFILLIGWLAGCSGFTIQDSYEPIVISPEPTAVIVTATPLPGGSAEVGATFYKAWEKQDYLGMYSLLSPQSQALVDSQSFVSRYETAMRTATVQSVSTHPVASSQDGNRASLTTQVIWETAVLGQIVRDHTAELVYSEGRWGIAWHEGLILPELAGGNTLTMKYRAPSRANIYDRNGTALAYQGDAILLGVVPGQIRDEASLLATLSPILGRTPDELRELYAQAEPDWYVPIGQVPSDVMQENYDAIQAHIGAGLTADPRLTRIYSGVAPHIVGYIGSISPEFANEYLSLGYQEDAQIGLSGLEAWGEEYLSGLKGGVLDVIDANGRYVATIAETEPRQARSIYTTFEAEFQAAVEEALSEAAGRLGRKGAVVVMDVNSGEILAMASYPSFNPGVFDKNRPNSAELVSRLFTDPNNPLVNRATGTYPPGSTFKIVTFSAAVTSGLYNPGSGYNSTGTWDKLGPTAVKVDWRAGGHGFISLRTALVVSCNTCFYDAGYNMDGQDPYHFPAIARAFGFGSPTNALGIFEAAGIIPDPDWKPANTAEGGWVTGDAVNMAIGQGYVAVTPLQMVRITAAIANGGTLIDPTVISKIGAGGGAPEEVIPPRLRQPLPISSEMVATIQQSLYDVTSSSAGTANFVFDGFRVPVAGKTGTAQTPQPLPHAWFTGYAPAAPYTLADGTVVDAPQIAVTVIMENAGEGSEIAAPIFRRIIEVYYSITPLTPYPW